MEVNTTPASEDGISSKPTPDEFLIVGLGASAGGVEALMQFFENVPPDSGMAYVVILHLSPDHDSQLTAILRNVTPIPVTQVIERVKVEPDHVYVVPPNRHLEMVDGDITVTPNLHIEERRAPVDIFFRTLAESHQNRAVGVILSGTGANGSMGIKRIKERGGAAFVQNPREAPYNEMPRNAIATNMIDEVLPVAVIPSHIIAYREGQGQVQIEPRPENRPNDQQAALREIFVQLRLRTGHDFSNYKRPTVLRRIERRISVRQLADVTEYAKYIRDNPEEAHALLKDLLISVTNFFRDKRPFDMLEREILPSIMAGKGAEEHVRIWVIGCATGEEAYSLAMLLAERTLGAIEAPKVQIFATDIDNAAIAVAREGLYTLNDAADVPPDRLRRFFSKEGDSYRVRREIREMVLFANHNVLKDPPFSHLDLVTCRNMLIYLNQSAQERVMETVHFALKPGGYLFLGGSESVDGSNDLYVPVSRENQIYQSRAVSTRQYPVPEALPTQRYEMMRPEDMVPEIPSRPLERMSYGDLHQQLLEQYAPPSVVVNEEYDIVHLSERAGRYLQIVGGEPTQNLLKMVRQELRLELRSALYQAVQLHANVETRPLSVQIGDQNEDLVIHVRPVLRAGDNSRGFILVLFEAVEGEAKHKEEVVITSQEPMAQHLEEELSRLKVQLRASVEQHELQAEELKASDEELQAMNEELRSAAEELETSKEELQSINEELATVNQELKIKIEETTQASNNLQNFVNSTDIGTIFLDRNFRVNLFTPAARHIFNLIPADFGRPLTDITNRLEYDGLLEDAETVLDKLQSVEREVRTADGQVHLMRMLPYRTQDDRIDGVVITFIDITTSKQTEAALVQGETEFRLLLNASSNTIYRMNADWSQMQNLKGQNFLADTEAPNRNWLAEYIPPQEQERVQEAIQVAIRNKATFELEHQVFRTDGSIGWTLSRAVPLLDEHNEIVEWFGAASDVSARKEAEAALRENEERLRALFDSMSEAFVIKEAIFDEAGRAIDYRYIDFNPAFIRHTGLIEARGHTVRELLPDIEPIWLENYDEVIKIGQPIQFEAHMGPPNRWLSVSASLLGGLGSRRVAVVFRDVTDRKRGDDELRALKDKLAADLAGMRRLYELNQRLMGTGDADQQAVLQSILAVAIDFCETDRGSIQLASPDGKQLRMAVHQGLGEEFVEHFKFGGSVATCEAALRTRQRVIVDDITQVRTIEGTEDVQAHLDEGIHAVQSTPLISREGKMLGILSTYSAEPGHISEEALRRIDLLAWMASDFIARTQTNLALQRSELHLSTIFAQASVGLSEITREGRFLRVNDELCRILGRSRKEVLKLSVTDVTHSEDIEPSSEALKKMAATGDPVSLDKRYLRPDGSMIWANSTLLSLDQDDSSQSILVVTVDLTPRIRSEQALRESEERLRLVLESVEDYAIITQDRRGIITGWNSGAEKTFGWTAAEAIGQPSSLIFVPEDREKGEPEKEIETALRDGRAEDERYHLHKSGSRPFVSGVLTRLKGDAGFVKVARDLTKRRQAENAVRESEARFRTLSDSVPQIIWVNEPNGRANYFNSRWFEYSGLTLEQSAGPGWQAIVHPDDAASSIERWRRSIESGEVFETEYRLRCHDGEYRWHIGRSAPIRNAEGQVTGWFGTATDIHDLKQAEAEVRANGDRFRAMFEQSTVGVSEYDLRRNHLFINQTFADSLGYSVGELLDMNLRDITHPEDWPHCLHLFKRAISTGGSFVNEKRLTCKDGSLIWISESISGIADLEGRINSVVAVGIDITARKKAEEELKTAHAELENRVEERTHELKLEVERGAQLEEERRQLTERIVSVQEEERGRISRELHDNLGQHLTAILLGIQALQAQSIELPDGERRATLSGLGRLFDMINDLTGIAHRLAWELRPAALDNVGLEAALQEYVRNWSTLGLEADFFSRIPKGETKISGAAETALYRVTQEALTNVQRHANASQVSVVLERSDEFVTVIVEDNGQGFDVEESVAKKRLGVIGMRERMDLVGGSLEVESTPGQGTTVYARVPLEKEG